MDGPRIIPRGLVLLVNSEKVKACYISVYMEAVICLIVLLC